MSGSHHGVRASFIERTIDGLRAAMDRALHADLSAASPGLLQRLDPRVKVVGIAALILASALAARLSVVAGVLVLAVILGAASHLSPWLLAKRVWLVTLPFSVVLAVPALFLTPGDAIYKIPGLDWEATAQGLRSAAFLILRSQAAATLALVLVFTTPWTHVLKALRTYRVPVIFVVILGMACRYVLLLLDTAHEMFESRKSRTVGVLTAPEQRRIAILSTGALLSRTFQLSDEVYLAMQARGFRGEVYILDDFRMTAADWSALAAFAGVTAVCIWAGR